MSTSISGLVHISLSFKLTCVAAFADISQRQYLKQHIQNKTHHLHKTYPSSGFSYLRKYTFIHPLIPEIRELFLVSSSTDTISHSNQLVRPTDFTSASSESAVPCSKPSSAILASSVERAVPWSLLCHSWCFWLYLLTFAPGQFYLCIAETHLKRSKPYLVAPHSDPSLVFHVG